MKTVRLRLEELACPTCAQKIGQVLEREKGVLSARVAYATATAVVEYDPELIDLDRITQVIGGLGYKVVGM
ncbi:MAG: heavy-metal-associated domain-containing protein [Limnochordia bacterium]|jgi:copper chaperone CopZ|nr:heavy-metal-associated domain-containing protein [Bacillota bacterium]